MQYLVSSAQMKAYDQAATENTGIPSLVLMERAAFATAEEIMSRFPLKRTERSLDKSRVLILAGCGNNGGDGFAIGRILAEHGYPVSFVLAGERERCSSETKAQMQILERLGEVVETDVPRGAFAVIVDALFGIGLSRSVTGRYREMIDWINASSACVVAVDIPSGIHADTGKVMEAAVRADLTVTYGYVKPGLILYPGAEYTGRVVCRKIGISHPAGEKPLGFVYDRTDLARLPVRKNDGNKGSFGRVLVIAGNERMCGACQFAALGAYRIGAGLVRVLTVKENRNILMQTVPEAIVDTYENEDVEGLLKEALDWADCVVAGPGIGTDERACLMMQYVWAHCRLPLVVDADGLNILASHPDWLQQDRDRREETGEIHETKVYFTPHLGEFSRLAKKSIKCCKEDIISAAVSYARDHGVILVCKDARTVAADPAGEIYLNTSGDNGMATGGSGDVLAGILAGLLAQGMQGLEAAALAVYLHGLAGNRASSVKSVYAVKAGDLLEALPEVLTEGGNRGWT